MLNSDYRVHWVGAFLNCSSSIVVLTVITDCADSSINLYCDILLTYTVVFIYDYNNIHYDSIEDFISKGEKSQSVFIKVLCYAHSITVIIAAYLFLIRFE